MMTGGPKQLPATEGSEPLLLGCSHPVVQYHQPALLERKAAQQGFGNDSKLSLLTPLWQLQVPPYGRFPQQSSDYTSQWKAVTT